ncbi:ankyrin repeat domain-containing protein [Trinickia mobilis]|uniref:ankyrin repeat domain-containing protein n=1 Tax=Trinickia mobilis TaxID=2816356 RepID=UPI002867F1F5|nr:ankyrin repeat domain-containing protein [Trinickia mobilis]
MQFIRFNGLVKAGADLNHEVPNFGSALRVVLNSQPPEFLRTLLDAGVDANTTTEGDTPIIFFVTKERTFESLKLLIARGANVDKRDSLRNTPLYEALMNNGLNQIAYLLDHGAHPNTYNINGISFPLVLSDDINRNARSPNSETSKKLTEIRDRIIKLGVK